MRNRHVQNQPKNKTEPDKKKRASKSECREFWRGYEEWLDERKNDHEYD